MKIKRFEVYKLPYVFQTGDHEIYKGNYRQLPRKRVGEHNIVKPL